VTLRVGEKGRATLVFQLRDGLGNTWYSVNVDFFDPFHQSIQRPTFFSATRNSLQCRVKSEAILASLAIAHTESS